MGNRQGNRSSRMGSRNDGRESGGGGPGRDGAHGGRGREGALPPPQRGEPNRAFDRNQDMGGSHWSGASGRGGYVPEVSGRRAGPPGQGRYPIQRGNRHAEIPYERHHDYGRYGNQSGYAGDREYAKFLYADAGRHEDHDAGGFLSEDVPGHVPNQRWGGGYGAARDREQEGYEPSGPPSGRGFTGNDFGGPSRQRVRAYDAPAEMDSRHFGNVVDRGGRMDLHGESTTGRGYWAWESEDRGPHYGKGPKGYKRSDDRTREDVCDAIAYQGSVDASDVEVKVADGVVTLSGTVTHRHEKRQLEHLAEQCRGVLEVRNELRLERSDAGKDKPSKQDRAADTADGSSNGTQNGKTLRS